jgi:S1-C subfamily serine protease
MSEMDPSVTNCGNCHLPMPRELRFCRNCGFRLGEGTAEYTETVRFQNAPPGMLPNNNAPMAPYNFTGGASALPYRGSGGKRRGFSGTTWMFIGLLIFFVTAAAFTAVVKRVRPTISRPGISIIAPHSVAGVNNWDTADGDIGVTFDYIETPGGPADKAGLVGGDIITTVDGTSVHSDDDMTELMRSMPIGKTVDIVYLRDGETKTTKLTTISQQDSERLESAFAARPEGEGFFGYDPGDAERVEIPNTKLFGVKLSNILSSRPADMAGIKEGDIVIKFDDVPIRTVREFGRRVKRALPYATIKLTIIRDGVEQVVPVKMGKA